MSEAWWKEAVIYQVYPSSFQDTNDDGWGDVKGITTRIDYLKELGVDIVWVSPIFKSPQADMGYDIADYKLIDPRYGTNEDVDVLIAELKKRDMKLMLDLVVNHTSDKHAWFEESRSSASSSKRSWYVWKKPKRDAAGNPLPPNNWSQILGDANSAWTYDSTTDEYFLSLFTPEQPDLNWENLEVRAAVHDVMSFWLERGVCGYRMDVINMISKDQRFPDAEPTMGPDLRYHPGGRYYLNGPRMHEFLREIQQKVLLKYGAITVGEMPEVDDVDEILKTVRSKDGELNMIFIFDVVNVDNVPGMGRMALRNWKVEDFTAPVTKWQRAMIDEDGWNSVFLENHDNPRSVSRYCDDSDAYREYGSKLLALMETTLNGTLFIYQGEEIGVRNMPKSWDVSEYKDIESINFWAKSKELYGDDPEQLSKARLVLEKKARDHARTPMQWDGSPHAGFCGEVIDPWMRVNDDYATVNTKIQMATEKSSDLSVWQYWQRSLANRKKYADAFVYGDYQPVDSGESRLVFAYTKSGKSGGKWIVILNFSGKDTQWVLPTEHKVEAWMTGNYTKGRPEKPLAGSVTLRPWEGLLGKLRQV